MFAEAIHIRTIPFVLVSLCTSNDFFDFFFSHTNLVTENLKYSAHILFTTFMLPFPIFVAPFCEFIIINASFKLTIRKCTFSLKKYTSTLGLY